MIFIKKVGFFMSGLLFFILSVHGQNEQAVISSFKKMKKNPTIIRIQNNQEVNNQGGHIQGVQLFSYQGERFAVLTGSSDSYSYYSVIKMGKQNEVISLNRLMDKPFKHAGGCQVFQNYLAVGIEDNEIKDKSKVCIYDLSPLKKTPPKPDVEIERTGEPYRSTAGCVGITKYDDTFLLAVGDWDIKYIDFYSCDLNQAQNVGWKLVSSIEVAAISKEDWINDRWYSYQNINLFTINSELYLVGLGEKKKNVGIADLFHISENKSGEYGLNKIATKKFNCKKGVSFQAAAGVVFSKDERFNIISTGYHIDNEIYLNYFEN